MKVAILSSQSRGLASLSIPRLATMGNGVELCLVLRNRNTIIPNRKKARERRLQKIWKIGVLGAIAGASMRKWFVEDVQARLEMPPIEELTARYGIPYRETPTINCPETVETLRQFAPDVLLSLGNSYIAKSVFSIPPMGTINFHHEVLPEYRGARSVIWQIHNNSAETGFTCHLVDAKIDNGAILLQRRLPIEFKETLRETSAHNYARLLVASADALPDLLTNFPELLKQVGPQGPGTSYTTPTFRQFLRMRRNHRRLRQEAAARKS